VAVFHARLAHRSSVISAIQDDKGPELVSGAVKPLADRHGIWFDHIQPGQPQQNAYIEHLNRTVRYDWLAQALFGTIEEVQLHRLKHYLARYSLGIFSAYPVSGPGCISPGSAFQSSRPRPTIGILISLLM
jgi:hypothetical protein